LKLAHLSATALGFLLALGTGTAAVENASVIGMTSGLTGATLDNSKVGSGATLFDGSTVQTTSIGDGSYTRIHLNDGTRLELGAASKAQVFAKRATLEIGTSEVQSASGYEIDTQLLKIQPSGASSVATVRVDAGNKVYVTALNAPVNVLNRDGMLVARVNPGLPLSFLPQAGAVGSFDDTGCVLQKSGAAIFSPSAGNTVSELRGADLRKAVGNTTHVMGSVDSSATPAGGATQVIHVTGFTVTKKGGCSDKAAALGATTAAAGLGAAATAGAVGAAGAGAAVGISTTAIVVGSVAAATAVGIGAAAATGAFSSSSP
jgi:hypothetical protein